MSNKNYKKIILFTAPLLPIIGVGVWAAITFTKKTSSEDTSKHAKKLNDNKNASKTDSDKKDNTVKVEEVEKPKNDSNDDENVIIISRVRKPLPKIANDDNPALTMPDKNPKDKTSQNEAKPNPNNDPDKKDAPKNDDSENKTNKDENLTPEEKQEKVEKINEIKTKTSDWIKEQLISYFLLSANEVNVLLKNDLEDIVKKIEKKLNLENTNLQDLKDESKMKGEVENLIKDNITLQAAGGRSIPINESNYNDYFKVSEVGQRNSKDTEEHKPSIVFNTNLNNKKYWFVNKQSSDVSLKFDVADKEGRNSLFVKFVEIIVPGKDKSDHVNVSHFKEYFYVEVKNRNDEIKRIDLKNAKVEQFSQFGSKQSKHNFNNFRVTVDEEISSLNIIFPHSLQPKEPIIYQVKIKSFPINLVWIGEEVE